MVSNLLHWTTTNYLRNERFPALTGDVSNQAGTVNISVKRLGSLTEYADNATALAAGLVAGDLYHTAGVVKVVT